MQSQTTIIWRIYQELKDLCLCKIWKTLSMHLQQWFYRSPLNSPVLRSLCWLPVCQRTDFKTLLLVYKVLNGFRRKYMILICCKVMNKPDLSDLLGNVCFLSSESKLNTSRIHYQKTACLLLLLSFLNQVWRIFCLLLLFIRSSLRHLICILQCTVTFLLPFYVLF